MNQKEEKKALLDKFMYGEISGEELEQLYELSETDIELREELDFENRLLNMRTTKKELDLIKKIKAWDQESQSSGRRERLIQKYAFEKGDVEKHNHTSLRTLFMTLGVFLFLGLSYAVYHIFSDENGKEPELIANLIDKNIGHYPNYITHRNMEVDEQLTKLRNDFFEKYDDRNYLAAADGMIQYLNIKSDDNAIRFYLGHCQLHLHGTQPNMLKNAIQNFEHIQNEEEETFLFYEETVFNLFIAYLVNEDAESADVLRVELLKYPNRIKSVENVIREFRKE